MDDLSKYNLIFLDVDGVLNSSRTINKVPDTGYIGISDDHLKVLKDIVTDSRIDNIIILSSSWRSYFKYNNSPLTIYLKSRLKEFNLEIYDTTEYHKGQGGYNRGEQIINYLAHNGYNNYIILDDESFDFESCGIGDRVIQTEFYGDDGGLQLKHVEIAKNLLKTEPKVKITEEYANNISKIKNENYNAYISQIINKQHVGVPLEGDK